VRYDPFERDDGRLAMAIAQRRMTLDEFLSLPEEKPALELVDGEVTQKVAPQTRHAAMQFEVAAQFNGFARPRKLGRAFPEHRSSYDNASTVPDVAYFVRDRIPRDRRGLLENRVCSPPDSAFEIASPDQPVSNLLLRCLWYIAHGVRIALMIEPERRWAALFRPASEPIVVGDAGTLDLGDVIPGFVLDVGQLFQSLYVD
jgi:Uma2 family endonuclease